MSDFGTADLYDEHGEALASCDLPLRDYGGTVVFSGRITTVRCYEDNVVVRAVLSEPAPTDGTARVLVVDGGGSLHTALMGDQIAQLAIDQSWAGVVINGAVRDVAVLATMALGVKALGSNPRKSAKRGEGTRDVPVQFGGALFTPGAMLYADLDGIVVLPASGVTEPRLAT